MTSPSKTPRYDAFIAKQPPIFIANVSERAREGLELIRELELSLSDSTSFALKERTAETLDAERYRYLRNAAGQYLGDECGPAVCSGCSDLFEYHFGPEVDQIVDEAIATWKAAGCPLPKVPA